LELSPRFPVTGAVADTATPVEVPYLIIEKITHLMAAAEIALPGLF
jgi:hypothetical protein